MKNLKYLLLLTIVLWLCGFWYMFCGHSNSNSNNKNEKKNNNFLYKVIQNLEKDLSNLEEKYKVNEQLINDLNEKSNRNHQNIINSELIVKNDQLNNGPSYLHEDLRRKIYDDVKDVSFFIESQLKSLNSKLANQNTKNDDIAKNIDFLKSDFRDRINLILTNLRNLSISDQYGDWRKSESFKLGQQVQEKFKKLQNPQNCETSQKIICDLNKACGFGCQIHHVMYCFIVSFFTNRVMILESDGWRYNSAGYEAYFEPVSETCTKTDDKAVQWNEPDSLLAKSIKMPIIDVITNKPAYLPLSIPKEYEDILKKIHGDPFVWWAGQILYYLMRFNKQFTNVVKSTEEKLKFKQPCVGVHVRRSDKIGSEAAFHGLKEYMDHVEAFFDLYEKMHPNLESRNIYLATDEVSVLLEAKSKYPKYNFIFDETNAKTANVNQRYTPESAQGVILDTYFLSQCDYLVCTFSSQVCRLAYELMQTRYPDASWRYKSLDDVYYYGGQNGHWVVAIADHKARREYGEIELRVGDKIGLAGNHWDGYSKGRNTRTNEEGLFPSYKVKNFIESV